MLAGLPHRFVPLEPSLTSNEQTFGTSHVRGRKASGGHSDATSPWLLHSRLTADPLALSSLTVPVQPSPGNMLQDDEARSLRSAEPSADGAPVDSICGESDASTKELRGAQPLRVQFAGLASHAQAHANHGPEAATGEVASSAGGQANVISAERSHLPASGAVDTVSFGSASASAETPTNMDRLQRTDRSGRITENGSGRVPVPAQREPLEGYAADSIQPLDCSDPALASDSIAPSAIRADRIQSGKMRSAGTPAALNVPRGDPAVSDAAEGTVCSAPAPDPKARSAFHAEPTAAGTLSLEPGENKDPVRSLGNPPTGPRPAIERATAQTSATEGADDPRATPPPPRQAPAASAISLGEHRVQKDSTSLTRKVDQEHCGADAHASGAAWSDNTRPSLMTPAHAPVEMPNRENAPAHNPAMPSRDTFAALDASTSGASATWTHAGTREAEAGYLDPSLGWVRVRAQATAGTMHATILPASSDAAQALGPHLEGLNSYISERHGQGSHVSIASPTGHSQSGHSQSGPNHSGQDTPARQNLPSATYQPTNLASGPADRGVNASAFSNGAQYISVLA